MGLAADLAADGALDGGAVVDCPYPGLRPFSEHDAKFFFGREKEIGQITAMLEDHQLVVVHGASGCGKSSVVRAGVIPLFRLDALANDKEGRVIIVRPGDPGGPLEALARKLDEVLPLGDMQASPDDLLGRSWSGRLAASPDWCGDIAAATDDAGAVLCLVIDQFEEIFAAVRAGYGAQAERLIDFLVDLGEAAARGTGLGERALSVIVTMRSDYLGNCAAWEGFAEAVNRSQYLLPRISTYGALCAIHEPARRNRGVVDEDVVDRLLAVIAREIDGLPILQHALMRAWREARVEDRVTKVDLVALEKAGGAEHALSRHAESIVEEIVSQKAHLGVAIDWMFRSLSDLDTDKRIIRRSVSLARLSRETGAEPADVRYIVDTFRRRENSLLSPFPPDPLDDDSIVTVGHETLLRQWERISDRSYRDGRPVGLALLEFQDGMIWRSLVVGAEGFARNRKNVLSPAATEQRMAWYRTIAQRRGWITRHLLATDSGAVGGEADHNAQESAETDKQWADVSAYMRASEQNLARVAARDRRDKITISLLSLLLIIAISSLFYRKYSDQSQQIMDKNDELTKRQTELSNKDSELTKKVIAVDNLSANYKIVAAQLQAVKYCSFINKDEADRLNRCVADQSTKYFEDMSKSSSKIAQVPSDLPQSPYPDRYPNGVGKAPQRGKP